MDRNPRDHAVAWDVVTNASCIAAVRSLVSVASTSALGHQRTSKFKSPMSALRSKADILQRGPNVPYVPIVDMRARCLCSSAYGFR